MKILILNGSPRKNSNTRALLEQIAAGAQGHQVQLVDVAGLQVGGCRGCDACRKNGGSCVQRDDFAALLEQMRAADCILFGTPVYFWGISAQLKLCIDRLYAGGEGILHKQVGMVAVGADSLDGPQYRLIAEQFACIAEHLSWQVLFQEPVSASEAGEVLGHPELLERMRQIGGRL